MQYLTLWLLMKAFAGGCAAMTGVEAVSNGVTAFREPKSSNANRALTVIIGTLLVLLLGLAYVAKAYGVSAMADPMAHGISKRALDRGCGCVRARVVLLPYDGQCAGGAVIQREYGVCGLPAAGSGDCHARLFSARVPGTGSAGCCSGVRGIYVLAGLTALVAAASSSMV